jgi:hypothetical protein
MLAATIIRRPFAVTISTRLAPNALRSAPASCSGAAVTIAGTNPAAAASSPPSRPSRQALRQFKRSWRDIHAGAPRQLPANRRTGRQQISPMHSAAMHKEVRPHPFSAPSTRARDREVRDRAASSAPLGWLSSRRRRDEAIANAGYELKLLQRAARNPKLRAALAAYDTLRHLACYTKKRSRRPQILPAFASMMTTTESF